MLWLYWENVYVFFILSQEKMYVHDMIYVYTINRIYS